MELATRPTALDEAKELLQSYGLKIPDEDSYFATADNIDLILTLVEHGYRVDRQRDYLRVVGPARKAANHHNSTGDLVVEEKTLFRQVGWRGYSGAFYPMGADLTTETVGFQPVYVQIAKWTPGEGWAD